jgi:hypothetical protein
MNYDVLSPNKDFFFRVGERGGGGGGEGGPWVMRGEWNLVGLGSGNFGNMVACL